jgi:O-antigen/teichoic acid export membrane protein
MTETLNSLWKGTRRFLRTRTFLRHSLFLNASYLSVANLTRSASGFVFWFLAARLYSKETLGLAAAVTSAMLLMGTISYLGLGQGLVRFLPQSKRRPLLVNASLALITLACGLAALVFLVGIKWWSPALTGTLTGWLAGSAFVGLSVGYILYEALTSVFIGLRTARNVFILAVLSGGLRIGMLPLMWLVSRDALFLFVAYGTPLLVSFIVGLSVLLPRCLPGYRLSLKQVSPGEKPELARRENPQIVTAETGGNDNPPMGISLFRTVVPYSLANYVNNFLWMAPMRLFPLIALNTLGEEAAADLYIAWLVASSIEVLSGSLAISLFAEGSSVRDRISEDTRRTLWGGLLVTGTCATVLLIFARPIVLVFGTEYSSEAAQLLRLFGIAIVLGVVPTTYMGMARAEGLMGSLIGISAVRASVVLFAGIILAVNVGVSGIGMAWIGAQTVAAGLVAMRMLRRVKAPLLADKIGE